MVPENASYRSLLVSLAISLLAGCDLQSPTAPVLECANPAPLHTKPRRVPGSYIVIFRPGTDASAEADRLRAKYQLRVTSVWESALLGFAVGDASPFTIAKLRCEPSILLIEENQYGEYAGTA